MTNRHGCASADQVLRRGLKAPANQADIDTSAFIQINAAEGVDATEKGLIIRDSLLKKPGYFRISGPKACARV